MSTIERRKLGMHENLLYNTIQRQAGTLEKANVEGIMNSIEAGGDSVYVTLDVNVDGTNNAVMTIRDNGRGIRDKKEIEEFFEKFGTPHNEDETVIWKLYRMGRGQMFAHGKNIWRTSTFRMVVDIKEWGLEYELESGLPFHEGCDIKIELYKNPIGGYTYPTLQKYEDNIQKQVRYVKVPVYFNGKQINVVPEEMKWDIVDENAYYLLNVGTELRLYNLGIYVMNIDISKYGAGGIIVSKKQLSVNYARNDVMSDCPVYNEIQKIVSDNLTKIACKKRQVLDSYQRNALLQNFRDDMIPYETVKLLSLVPTSQGKHMSFEAISRIKTPWTFAEKGSDLADKLMEIGQCVCFSEEVLHNLNYSGDKKRFFTWLTRDEYGARYGNDKWSHLERLYVDFDEMLKNTSEEYLVFPENRMTVLEKRVIRILNKYRSWNGRVINLGFSDRANAWTDGRSFISINRAFLNSLYLGDDVCVNRLMMLLAHEMAHDIDTRGTHVHGPEFYENMVMILNSYNSPTALNARFNKRMIAERYDEKKFLAEKKKAKSDKKIEEKLGMC